MYPHLSFRTKKERRKKKCGPEALSLSLFFCLPIFNNTLARRYDFLHLRFALSADDSLVSPLSLLLSFFFFFIFLFTDYIRWIRINYIDHSLVND